MKIAIDCGHGSNTAGKRTPPFKKAVDINGDGIIDVKKGEQYREHYANVGVAVELNKELLRCGFQTVKVSWNDDNGKDDKNMSLIDRQKLIKSAKCDLSISIHYNAYGDGSTFNGSEGIGTFIHSNSNKSKDSMAFAKIVQKYLVQGTTQKNRGVKMLPLAMCNALVMGTKASILVELAFMTNEREAQELMANRQFWKECATEICKGVCEYTKMPYIGEEEKKNLKKENPYTMPKEIIYYREKNMMTGNSVKWVQWELIDAGFENVKVNGVFKKVTIDGKCGKITDTAIRLYQKANGLTVDGKVGPNTKEKMKND